MAKVGKRYFTAEFKREAVALWETSGRTQTEVAGELGIMPTNVECSDVAAAVTTKEADGKDASEW